MFCINSGLLFEIIVLMLSTHIVSCCNYITVAGIQNVDELNGLYAWQGERFSHYYWKHISMNIFIVYDYVGHNTSSENNGEWFWTDTDDKNGNYNQLFAYISANEYSIPETTDSSKLQVFVNDTLIQEEDADVRCTHETTTIATTPYDIDDVADLTSSCRYIKVSGREDSETHSHINGIYEWFGYDHASLPFWKHEETQMFIYFDVETERWSWADQLGANYVQAKLNSKTSKPETSSENVLYFGSGLAESRYLPDDDVDSKCSKSDPSELSTAATAGIIVGSIAVFILLFACIYYSLREPKVQIISPSSNAPTYDPELQEVHDVVPVVENGGSSRYSFMYDTSTTTAHHVDAAINTTKHNNQESHQYQSSQTQC